MGEIAFATFQLGFYDSRHQHRGFSESWDDPHNDPVQYMVLWLWIEGYQAQEKTVMFCEGDLGRDQG
jgi:hypothetical protein